MYTKEKKEKVEVLKYKDYEDYTQRVINKPLGNVNITNNDKYTMLINDVGEGYSKFEDIYVTKYNESCKHSNIIYIKDVDSNLFWSNTLHPNCKEPDEYLVSFSPAESKFYRRDGLIETLTRISVSPEENVELRQLEIRNNSNHKINLDIMSYIEPVLAERNSEIVHPAYNNLFLCASNIEGKVLIDKRFSNGEKIYFTNFAVCNEFNAKFEVELNKSKILGRLNSIDHPDILIENKMFSNNISSVTNTAVALKTSLILQENSSAVINYYIGISRNQNDIEAFISKYSKVDADKRLFELAKSKSLIENRFVGIKSKEIEIYNKLIAHVVNGSSTISKYKEIIERNTKNQRSLWRFGISGDFPIILLTIKSVNDEYIVKQLVKAVEYFNVKNIKIDLVIIDEENGKEKYVFSKIKEYIYARNLSYLINANGGFHVIKNKELEDGDMELLYSCSDIIFKAEDGFLEEQLDE